jgi:AcrR family transcriptional regulator
MGLRVSELDGKLAAERPPSTSRPRPIAPAPPVARPSGSTPPASPFRSALIDLCFERGFAALTIDDLCRRAGLGRAAFKQRYSDLEDCFFQIAREELRRYHHRAAAARSGLGEWRSRLRATAYALYRFLDEDERLRRFTVVDVRAAGERPALLLGEEIEALFDLIDEGRAEPTAPPTLTRATAESLAGGIFNEIYVAAGHRGPMPREEEIVPKLMYSAVLPYLGETSAREELVIPPPPG